MLKQLGRGMNKTIIAKMKIIRSNKTKKQKTKRKWMNVK